jgi:hypothetical protein
LKAVRLGASRVSRHSDSLLADWLAAIDRAALNRGYMSRPIRPDSDLAHAGLHGSR